MDPRRGRRAERCKRANPSLRCIGVFRVRTRATVRGHLAAIKYFHKVFAGWELSTAYCMVVAIGKRIYRAHGKSEVRPTIRRPLTRTMLGSRLGHPNASPGRKNEMLRTKRHFVWQTISLTCVQRQLLCSPTIYAKLMGLNSTVTPGNGVH